MPRLVKLERGRDIVMVNVDTQKRVFAGSLNVHESMIYRLHQRYDANGSTTDIT